MTARLAILLLFAAFSAWAQPISVEKRISDSLNVAIRSGNGTIKVDSVYADWVQWAGGGGTGIPAWSAGTAYDQNAPVSWGAYTCFSSVAGTGTNTGHTPAAPPGNSYWGCYDNIGAVTQYIFNNFVFAE